MVQEGHQQALRGYGLSRQPQVGPASPRVWDPRVWDPHVGFACVGSRVWDPRVGSTCGEFACVGSPCGIRVWDPRAWDPRARSVCGIRVWDPRVGSACEIHISLLRLSPLSPPHLPLLSLISLPSLLTIPTGEACSQTSLSRCWQRRQPSSMPQIPTRIPSHPHPQSDPGPR